MIPHTEIELHDGLKLPVHSIATVIVGSGAAALNCAEHLFRFLQERGVDAPADQLAVVTAGVGRGTSHNSGSDKQTYYRLGIQGDVADSPADFARTLTAAGCCHGDLALIEGENALREFYHLVENGVPFPHNPRGGFVGYKTDHDPRQRATSAGPWTSRFMVRKSLAQVRRHGIGVFDRHEVIALLTDERDGAARAVGLLAVDRDRTDQPDRGLIVFNADAVVMATGGPGDMYASSVYPPAQMGTHGLCFEAGAVAENLTESQFGLASVRPRWNLSGTYQQVIPRYFSTGADGNDEREFLNPYFPDMTTLATDIFLKGYQWPFDPDKVANHGSSLVDILVAVEIQEHGRRCWMDFRTNPVATDGLEAFSLDRLGEEARKYLANSGALQATPIERLAHMNQPSIDLYAERGVDLHAEPLEIAVCAQHNNGGFAVDTWWESNVGRLFFIGEQAGTHGVKRPGGTALNAGQVGGLRAAQRIAHVYHNGAPSLDAFLASAGGQLRRRWEAIQRVIAQGKTAERTPSDVRREIQERMSRAGAFCRQPSTVAEALDEATRLQARIDGEGLRLDRPDDFLKAIRVRDMCLTHVAYLTAIDAMLRQGGGSRGSHLVLSPDGIPLHDRLPDAWRARPENISLRDEVLQVRLEAAGEFVTQNTPTRPVPEESYWFENTWSAYRDGDVFR